MERNDRYKVVTFLVLLCVGMLFVVFYSRVSKDAIKDSVKVAYSTVIKTQLGDSVSYDSIKSNIERFRQIDSAGYTSDVEAIRYIIKDYQRLSQENDSLKHKQ
jgi:cell division protein FtsX